MRLLDLFCGAGGSAVGYARAGFEVVVGVDNRPMKRYPFEFVQADALEYLASVKPGDFDMIHASPPCQRYCSMRRTRWADREHADLVLPTRTLLAKLGTPWVIENVPGAPLVAPVLLCGTMFALQTSEGSQLRRHRLFEIGLTRARVLAKCHLPECRHNDGYAIGVYGGGQHPLRRLDKRRRPATIGVWGHSGGHSKRDGVDHYGVEARREAMGIEWMSQTELSQAIPPAYTEWVGRRMLEAIR